MFLVYCFLTTESGFVKGQPIYCISKDIWLVLDTLDYPELFDKTMSPFLCLIVAELPDLLNLKFNHFNCVKNMNDTVCLLLE